MNAKALRSAATQASMDKARTGVVENETKRASISTPGARLHSPRSTLPSDRKSEHKSKAKADKAPLPVLGSEIRARAEEGADGRRRPGRPPSKPPPAPLPFNGIVDSPSDTDNKIEFVYGSPEVLKSMFTYFKNLKARDVRIHFTHTGVSFFSRDHTKSCRVAATIPGTAVNWYYCREPFTTAVNREKVEKMFASINKSFNKFTIVIKNDDADKIVFLLKDPELDKECAHKFPTVTLEADDELTYAEKEITAEMLEPGPDCKFPVQFVLSSKAFKKTIVDASAYSDYLVVEKSGGDSPLQFVYDKIGAAYCETYKSAEKIKLVSCVEDGARFRCTLNLANIKSLATSMVTDSVSIFAREDGDILLRSVLDEKALTISTFAKLGEEPLS